MICTFREAAQTLILSVLIPLSYDPGLVVVGIVRPEAPEYVLVYDAGAAGEVLDFTVEGVGCYQARAFSGRGASDVSTRTVCATISPSPMP